MRILSIDTSCDETAAAVVQNIQVHSNKIWSSASLQAKFGGVKPSVAQRAHEERIDWVVKKALGSKYKSLNGIDAVAVTTGPGLAIALGVSINYAKNLAKKYKKPLIPVNHIEGHLLSPFAVPDSTKNNNSISFPAYGLVLSGGTTLLCKIEDISKYKVLAKTGDDALGEALDKAARLLGFGYPGAEVLEKYAREGNPDKYELPVPLIGDREKNRFSYSGLKTAFVRLHESIENPTRQDICDLAATFQDTAFKHIINVLEYQIEQGDKNIRRLLFGGGVSNNIELKARLRKTCRKDRIALHVPYSKKLTGDNAAMIGVCAYLKNKELTKEELNSRYLTYNKVDRDAKLNI